MLFFITILEQGDFRHFHFEYDELEIGFDVLNRLVAKGNVLVKVTMIDGSSAIHLPVEAFDGQCGQSAIKALEHEWRAILMSPLNRNNNRDLDYLS
ncbi:hypothetical protein GO755_39665 [Spirosoma sp. HMF4905]|uniref:Uncharacterized protein n=1 Tax=Spirosoma arboris TaxID=2682092 RepID=A0A7K1SRI8_9BACT|nr:hypothetical protein [Spirosoma arboris]MVM36196.1 hypothetical protein [Spirosoma arboris]